MKLEKALQNSNMKAFIRFVANISKITSKSDYIFTL